MRSEFLNINRITILLITCFLCACHSEEEYDMEEKNLTLVNNVEGAPANLKYLIQDCFENYLSPEYKGQEFCVLCNSGDDINKLFPDHNPFSSVDLSKYSVVFAQYQTSEPYFLFHQYLSIKEGIGTLTAYIDKSYIGGWPMETFQYICGVYPKTKLKEIHFNKIEAVSGPMPSSDEIYVYQTKVPIRVENKEDMPRWLIDEILNYQDGPGLYVFQGKIQNKEYYLIINTLIYNQFYLYDPQLYDMNGTREEGEIFRDLLEKHNSLLDDMRCIYYHVLTDDAIKMFPTMKVYLYNIQD